MEYDLDDTTISTQGNDYFIAPNAAVIGQVIMGKDASIWFGCTVRGDNEPISIGDGSSVQDNCVLHTDIGYPIILKKNCSIGHMVMLHGCTVGERSLIGIGSIVLNGALPGEYCFNPITGSPDLHIGGTPKIGQLLHGLVGRSIFAQAY